MTWKFRIIEDINLDIPSVFKCNLYCISSLEYAATVVAVKLMKTT